MAFIAAKCPACGGEIQLDNARESGFCVYCGAKVLLEEAIPKKVVIEGLSTLETKLKNAEAYIKLGNYNKAESIYQKLTEDFTSDYRAWWGLAKLDCHDAFYGNYDVCYYDEIENQCYYRNAMLFANELEREYINNEYKSYKSKVRQCRETSDKIIRRISQDKYYAPLNHALHSESGFEIYDNELYYWTTYLHDGHVEFFKIKSISNTGEILTNESLQGHTCLENSTLEYVDDNRVITSKISHYADYASMAGELFKYDTHYEILPERPEKIRSLSPIPSSPTSIYSSSTSKKKQSLSSWFFGV